MLRALLFLMLFSGAAGAAMTSTTEIRANINTPRCTVTMPLEVNFGSVSYNDTKYSSDFVITISCPVSVNTYMLANIVKSGSNSSLPWVNFSTSTGQDSGSKMITMINNSGTWNNIYEGTPFCWGTATNKACKLKSKAITGTKFYGDADIQMRFDLVYQ
ncbi:hypothetical protein RTF02_003814 [Salmonella enterica subsp. enterica]|nr:hypothetical protein [Salmonella enterica]ELJ2931539.1 hypothetical protein [Salmonella enterica subsp. enterica]